MEHKIKKYPSPPHHFGYIYIWFDTVRRKFCIGSHYGNLHDTYLTSTGYCRHAITKRPNTFRFRVLEFVVVDDRKLVQDRETFWLSKIKDGELGSKYYNRKKVAAGGDIFSTLNDYQKEQFKSKCSEASKRFWENNNEAKGKLKQTAFGGNQFDRSYMQSESYREAMKKSTSGEKNGFYGKTHSEEFKQWRTSENKKNPPRQKLYYVLKDGQNYGPFNGHKEIEDFFRLKEAISIKWFKFIDTNVPVKSIRKEAQTHPLFGAIIFSRNKNESTDLN